MNHKAFLENDDQFILSYELLYILQWLMTYEKEAFTQLIHKSFIQGSQDTDHEAYDQFEEHEYLQNSIIDFFSFLEKEVQTIAESESLKHIMQKNLLQTLDHIDPKIFDPAIIKESMMVTAEKVHLTGKRQVKDLFLKELLKKWHPKKDKNKKHAFN